jgi:hypothetical protein
LEPLQPAHRQVESHGTTGKPVVGQFAHVLVKVSQYFLPMAFLTETTISMERVALRQSHIDLSQRSTLPRSVYWTTMKNATEKQIQGNQLSLAVLAVIMTLTAIVLWISISGQPWPTWLLALAAVL